MEADPSISCSLLHEVCPTQFANNRCSPALGQVSERCDGIDAEMPPWVKRQEREDILCWKLKVLVRAGDRRSDCEIFISKAIEPLPVIGHLIYKCGNGQIWLLCENSSTYTQCERELPAKRHQAVYGHRVTRYPHITSPRSCHRDRY